MEEEEENTSLGAVACQGGPYGLHIIMKDINKKLGFSSLLLETAINVIEITLYKESHLPLVYKIAINNFTL
jgi:hypothetical protein